MQALTNGGQGAVRRIKRAQSLLAADAQATDEMIARTVGVGTSTVYRTKQRFVEDGLDRALSEMPRPGAPRKLGASDEALLVAVACSHPPSGRARWTMNLLAGEVVRLTAHETLSGDTVGRRLAEMKLKPWQEKMWCIPTVNAEYVARMEDVLDLYAEAPDPRRPVVGFDETPRQLIGEARVPIPRCTRCSTRFTCKVFLTDALEYVTGACATCMIDNTHVVVASGTGARMVPAPEMAAFAERFHFTLSVS